MELDPEAYVGSMNSTYSKRSMDSVCLMREGCAGEMAHRLGVWTALAEDLSSAPSVCVGWLTTV